MQLPDGLRKRAFVLGIYSSAVHARWIEPAGIVKVAALAVASEPYIFWRGEDAAQHIPTIDKRLGRLEAASPSNNGPSGRALDEFYLKPLGLVREDVWLSDLVPNTLSNKGQKRAIENLYDPVRESFNLPKSNIPQVPRSKAQWTASIDVGRILDELRNSQARVVITLGNVVIDHFLNRVCRDSLSPLTLNEYGLRQNAVIEDKSYVVIRLAHMRVTVIRPLPKWKDKHAEWVKRANILES